MISLLWKGKSLTFFYSVVAYSLFLSEALLLSGKSSIAGCLLTEGENFYFCILSDGLMLQELKRIIDDSPETIQEKKKRQNWLFSLLQSGPKHKDDSAYGLQIFFRLNFLGEEVGNPYSPQTGNSCTGQLLQAVGQLSVQP